MTAEVAIIIPTFNECGNIVPLVEALTRALEDVRWEAIFVDDDSTDGTAERVAELALSDARIRCIRRIGRRGLASASIEGMASSSAPYLAVMDADLQHDEKLLPEMLKYLAAHAQCDLIVGSRYMRGGGVGDWSSDRQLLSKFATRLSRRLMKVEVTDPMSGFFMVRREVFWEVARSLSGLGFKILLDILTSSRRPLEVHEMPFRFRNRNSGESKLDSMNALEFVMLVFDKHLGWLMPPQFVLFTAVGSTGALLHLTVLAILFRTAGVNFWPAQALATAAAILSNFVLNNQLTYRDRRLRGTRLYQGLMLFLAICSAGAFANIQIAYYLFRSGIPWWLAGLAGAVIGAVWNYSLSTHIVWGRERRRR